MPILDLNEWPQENNVSAVYILWARMVFPNDPKLRKQFSAISLADLKTNSGIFSKNSNLTKDIPREVLKLLCDIGSGKPPDESKSSIKDQFLRKGGIKTLLHAPKGSEILEQFVSCFYRGKIAGEILLLLRQMDDAKVESGGPSVNKATHILEKIHADYYRNLGQLAHIRHFKESFREYKSVAHLWATYCLSRESKKYPDEHKPNSSRGLVGFFNIAEGFRNFGTTLFPHTRREPIILEKESLYPPKNLPPLSLEIPIPPLSKKQLQVLKIYQAPKNLNE